MPSSGSHARKGYLLAIAAVALYAGAIVFFVVPLEDWVDTFVVVSWLFLPGVIGSLAYAILEPRGSFDETRTLP